MQPAEPYFITWRMSSNHSARLRPAGWLHFSNYPILLCITSHDT